MTKPPCAFWKIWTGGEVEGNFELGHETLFIRELENWEELESILVLKNHLSRIWFCKEFKDWSIVLRLHQTFPAKSINLEVEAGRLDEIPSSVLALVKVYLKVSDALRDWDFVCVGPAFSDEAFCIGSGDKVSPVQYLHDKKIR